MGNYRFKLSEMIPNAWFYKLKDLSNTTTTKPHKTHSKQKAPFPPQSHHHHRHHHHVNKTEHHSAQGDSQSNISDSRKSYYITRKLISKPDSQDPETFIPEKDPPRKLSRRRPTKRNSTSTKSSSSSVFSSNRSSSTSEYRSRATIHSQIPDPEGSPIQPKLRNEIPLLFKNRVPCSASCRCRLDPPENPEDDVIVSVDVKSLAKNRETSDGFDSKFGIELPPIIAKSEKFKENRVSTIDGIKEQQSGSSMRRLSSRSPGGNGVRLRVNSPRIMGSIGGGRRSISSRRKNKTESFAIVKSSFDPQRDFKESMVEMILENDIKESKELEELLACYLELNSDEYHDMIVKVFKQIWFDLNGHNNKQSKWKLP